MMVIAAATRRGDGNAVRDSDISNIEMDANKNKKKDGNGQSGASAKKGSPFNWYVRI
jgi:hypothetical protein